MNDFSFGIINCDIFALLKDISQIYEKKFNILEDWTIEKKQLSKILEKIYEFTKNHDELNQMILDSPEDNEWVKEITEEIMLLKKNILNFIINLTKKSNKFFMELHSGAGGKDAEDWNNMLFNMYVNYLEKNKIKYEILHKQKTDSGLGCATILITYPIIFFLGEIGIHRLVRISPFNANGKRQTSFASVYIYEYLEVSKIQIDTKDLRIDTFRASGAGGQHVNKTDSAIRITHIPSGLVVSCQSERSQHSNRETAMNALKSKLEAMELEKKNENQHFTDKVSVSWGNQFRSYTIDPYRKIKDSRTNIEINDVISTLDGKIQPLLDAYFPIAIKNNI